MDEHLYQYVGDAHVSQGLQGQKTSPVADVDGDMDEIVSPVFNCPLAVSVSVILELVVLLADLIQRIDLIDAVRASARRCFFIQATIVLPETLELESDMTCKIL